MAESMDKEKMAPGTGEPAMGEDAMMGEAPTMGDALTMGDAPMMGEPAMEDNPMMGEAPAEGKHESLRERVEHLIHHEHKE